jgi:GNAT superfamily N-acetyltransferase
VVTPHNELMATDPLQTALDEIEHRRAAGIGDLAAELRQRVDVLGDAPLNSRPRQEAFAEVMDALTPPGFDLFPMPDECFVELTSHVVRIVGVVVDVARRQLVATLGRRLFLDEGRVMHEILSLQRPYRGEGLAVLLLDRSFAFYDSIGLTSVEVHAALETGRWYWARLGFDFDDPTDEAFVRTWATVALLALGEQPLPPDAPARRLAQLGAGATPAQTISVEELHAHMSAFENARLADPATTTDYQRLGVAMSQRLGAPWLDEARLRECAELNGLAFDEPILLGRAVMICGLDWHGAFDLTDAGARAAFDEEFNRTLKKIAKRP